MNKTKKIAILLKILFCICWTSNGHKILNNFMWEKLKPSIKQNLESYKTIMIKSKDDGIAGRIDTDAKDRIDYVPGHGHMNLGDCQTKARDSMKEFMLAYRDADYRLAAYKLGFAIHYVQDMACPVHGGGIGGDTKPPKFSPLTETEAHHENEQTADWGTTEQKGFLNLEYSDFVKPASWASFLNVVSARARTVQNLIGNLVGTAAFSGADLRNYLKQRAELCYVHRRKIYTDNANAATHINNTRNCLIWDLAVESIIEERYMKTDSLKAYLANP